MWKVEWSKPSWRGSDFHAGSASPVPSNVLRAGRRWRGQGAIQADLKQTPLQQQKQLSAYNYLASEIFQTFTVNAVHRKGFDASLWVWWKPNGKQKV